MTYCARYCSIWPVRRSLIDMTAVQESEAGWIPAPNTFGSRLALVRNHLGMNIKQAAVAAGVDDAGWRMWEKGRQPRDLVEKARQISDALGCDFIWLLTGSVQTDATIRRYLRRYVHPRRSAASDGLVATPGFVPAA